jgi:hypothetical protein
VNWQSLSGRLGTLPLVLAGPILRQVTPSAVTVWFALLRPANVSLRVFETGSPGSPIMYTGDSANAHPATTTPIGKNLHIVAATLRCDAALVPGQIYCYDATFVTTGDSPTTQTLAQATTAAGGKPLTLAYDPHDFPSFALPPKDLNYLRLVHGSCRKPHGGSLKADQTPTPDQLATLDGLIASSANNALQRPHQLLLTGDQIYADDCDDELLVSLTDAGDVLLGWSGQGEIVPSADPTLHAAAALAPGTRWDVISSAGFTGDDRRSHLISLGEFFAMYLFAWSDALWGATLTYDEFDAIVDVTLAAHPDLTPPDKTVESEFLDRQKAVQTFRETLPAVRRALANVPTYMILDDHEVTDDFNMTRHFVDSVYADTNDLGLRIVQNALTAYAICEVWGNVPEQFDAATATAAGTQLLATLADIAGAADNPGQYEKSADTIRQLVGLHQRSDMDDGADGSMHAFHAGAASDTITVNGVAVNTKSLRYNFTVEGPSHQVLVTDTRTWRGFAGRSELPTLLYKQLADQIVNAEPVLGDRLQLLVCTTNAPPIAGIRMLVHAPVVALLSDAWQSVKGFVSSVVHPSAVEAPRGPSFIDHNDLYDSWVFPGRAFDEMIVALTSRVTPRNGTIVAPMVLLSGDVHFSFSSRLAYWATARLGDTTPQPAKIALAQLVSSSLKNEAGMTRQVQLGGYANPLNSGLVKAAPYIAAGAGAVLGAGAGAGLGAAFGSGERGELKDGAIGAAAGGLLGLVALNVILGGQIPPPLPEAYVGWNVPANGSDKLIANPDAKTTYPFKATATAPTFDQNLNPSELKGALTTPDYRYRLDYLRPVRGGQTKPVTPPPVPATDATAAQWAQAYAAAANTRTDVVSNGTKLPDCIGHNAIAEVTFVWPAGDASATGKLVHHRVHWQSPGPSGVAMWVEYDVSLDVDDPNYADLTQNVAP